MRPGSPTGPAPRDSVPERLEHLDAVAVRVSRVEPLEAGEGVALAPVDLGAGRAERGRDALEIVHDERRVGLARGHERVLDADVELGRDRAQRVVRPEPGA